MPASARQADCQTRSAAPRTTPVARVALLGAIGLASAVPAAAQTSYPNRPVRIIVGFLPGSSTDILARFVGAKLSERLGQQVVVDNRPGANSIIGSDLAAKATPDGHTLVLVTTSHTMNPALYKLPFDALRSFAPISMIGTGPLALVTSSSFPANTVRELVDLAKARPGTYTYGSAGMGGINHFGAELFARIAGVQFVHVPYKGGAPALTDVIAGQVHIMFGTLPLTLRQIKAGKIKAFGVSSAKRSPLMPEVPTIAEAGAPGYEINTWWGLMAPAGVPDAVLQRLNAELTGILAQPDSAQRLEAEGAEPRPMTSVAFGRLMAAEVEKWGRVAREANIRVN
jgi:tripartite-type tricarboxylate transporter receptor subunit TctC